MLLALLSTAHAPADMNIAGARLHPLKGNLKDYWAVTVSGNWRLIFKFKKDHASDITLIDYH